MMKRLFLTSCLLCCMLLAFATKHGVVLTIELTTQFAQPITISVGKLQQKIQLIPDQLEYKFDLPDLSKPVYGQINVGGYVKTIYLEPRKDLRVIITRTDLPWEKEYKFVGENADINTYLANVQPNLVTPEDYRLEPDQYIQKLKDLTAGNVDVLKSHKFNKQFMKMEAVRLNYLVHVRASRYLTQHFWESPTEMSGVEEYSEVPKVKAYLRDLLVDSYDYWYLDACREFYTNTISSLSRESFYTTDFNESTQKRCQFVLDNFKNTDLQKALIYRFMEIYVIREEGKPFGEELEKILAENIKDSYLVNALKEKMSEFNKIQVGNEFIGTDAYSDVNGNPVKLTDFKGKYVFIDIWATWCGPCCAEIPYLKKLEEKFHGRNIVFVSISVDSSKAAWLNKLKADDMTGVQLYGGARAKIQQDYSITGIPRFMLIDRDGKVINVEMTRPSDPKTAEALEALQGI